MLVWVRMTLTFEPLGVAAVSVVFGLHFSVCLWEREAWGVLLVCIVIMDDAMGIVSAMRSVFLGKVCLVSDSGQAINTIKYPHGLWVS